MNKLRPSTVAMLVSAALSASVVNAAPGHHNAISLDNFDYAGQNNTKSPAQALLSSKEKAMADRATATGNPSQYDAKMGKATFLWAPKNQAKPDLNLIAPENQNSYAASFYLNSLTGFSSEESAINRAELAYIHDEKAGPLVAKYRQKINGVLVFNKEYNIVMDREHNLVAGSGYLGKKITSNELLTLFGSFGTAEDAVKNAITDLSSGGTTVELTKAAKKGDYVLFDAKTVDGLNVVGQPRARKVFYDINGKMSSAYYVEVKLAEIDSVDSTDYSFVIDATGKTLFRKNLVAHVSDDHAVNYRVFAHEDGYPMEGPHGNVLPKLTEGPDKTEIVDMPMVSITELSRLDDKPWLEEDATITSGNNVFAYADVLPPQDFSFGDITVAMTSDKTFDYPYMEAERDNSFANRQSAIVNLFYFNNWMHDWWYDYGFNEEAGNAQQDNFGRGGVEGDALHVQAQDYSGLNNANMSTPADGGYPRMQQYLWTSKDAENGVDQGVNIISHPLELGLLQSTRLSAFGPQQYPALARNMVRAKDGNAVDSGSSTDACEPLTNADEMVNRIAILDRGSCAFTQKVLNAQNAGAVGVIIVNNVDDGTPAPMGGSDAAVTIPNVGLSYAEGQAIYTEMAKGVNVTASIFSNFPLKDSTFDNGIIAHEWGHYISNRLIGNSGGLINFQGRNMGEGWGDFHSLMFIVRKEDANIEGNEEWEIPFPTGTYVENFTSGIRRAPYTPNMDINPLTFQHITSDAEVPGLPPTNGGSPHAAGEVWATTLWDVYVKLLNMYEFEIAQSKMANYLVASYKATPIAPTYLEARDALLSVMLATSNEDYSAALAAFARRGMGFGAVGPDRFSTDNAGVTESYATELTTYVASNLSVTQAGVDVCTADGIIDAGESAYVSFDVKNRGSEALTGVTAQLQVLSEHDVTFANDGLITLDDMNLFESTSATSMMTLNAAGVVDTLQIGVTFPEAAEGDDIVEAMDLSFSSLVNYSFKKLPLNGSSATDYMEGFATVENFKENVMTGGAAAVGTQSLDNGSLIPFFESLNPGVSLGAQSMFLANNAFQSDVAVETDWVEVGYGDDFSISFWHFYLLEESWDGGVLEISLNGSPWIDVTSAGGQFAVGYNYAALQTNPSQALQDRPVFSGANGDLANFSFLGNEDRVSFGTFLNGQTVKFRFRISSDITESESGWWIDNVKFTNIASPIYNEVIAGDSVSCD